MSETAPAPGALREAYGSLDATRRKTYVASCVGVALDGMDNAFFGLVVPALIATWGISRGEAGLIATTSLLSAAAGGWLAGIISDRWGRLRVLQFTILWFSVFSLLSALARNPAELAVLRALYSLGFGGEMAVSIALVGEIASARWRATLLGGMHSMFSIGAALAAILFAICFSAFEPRIAWRVLFALGALPALLVYYIRRYIPASSNPQAAEAIERPRPMAIFREGRLRNTLLGSMIAWGTLAGVAGVQTWLPTYLATVRGLSILTTTTNIVLYQISHFIGYVVGGYLADRFGRRASFLVSSVMSLISALGYTMLSVGELGALALTVALGFFTATIYGAMAALFAELFPPEMRGSGVAFCYNCGRALASFAPAMIGLAAAHMALATAIGLFAGLAYGIVILAAFLVPETRGRNLLTE